jgi:hypothetical protein
MIKSKKMSWAGHVALMGGKWITTFWQKPEGKDYWPLSEGMANTETEYFICKMNIGCHEGIYVIEIGLNINVIIISYICLKICQYQLKLIKMLLI